MRTIMFTNQKGGVGKTTTAFNVACRLADKGNKVLLIDLDPQSNLTSCFMEEPPNDTIYTLLLRTEEDKESLANTVGEVILPVRDNLALIGCNNKFAGFEKYFSSNMNAQFLLKEFIEALATQIPDKLDFVVLDTPPALGLITVNAMVASDEVYIPMQSQEFALAGFQNVITTVKGIQARLNQSLKIKGIFFTSHNPRTNISKQLNQMLTESYPEIVMETYIPVNVALAESPSQKKSVFEYAPESKGAIAYNNLTEEIINKA
jgi:chromosome partitioning protein